MGEGEGEETDCGRRQESDGVLAHFQLQTSLLLDVDTRVVFAQTDRIGL